MCRSGRDGVKEPTRTILFHYLPTSTSPSSRSVLSRWNLDGELVLVSSISVPLPNFPLLRLPEGEL
ncbi:hypothetical protein YC2023_023961 [Brassica napus]